MKICPVSSRVHKNSDDFRLRYSRTLSLPPKPFKLHITKTQAKKPKQNLREQKQKLGKQKHISNTGEKRSTLELSKTQISFSGQHLLFRTQLKVAHIHITKNTTIWYTNTCNARFLEPAPGALVEPPPVPVSAVPVEASASSVSGHS